MRRLTCLVVGAVLVMVVGHSPVYAGSSDEAVPTPSEMSFEDLLLALEKSQQELQAAMEQFSEVLGHDRRLANIDMGETVFVQHGPEVTYTRGWYLKPCALDLIESDTGSVFRVSRVDDLDGWQKGDPVTVTAEGDGKHGVIAMALMKFLTSSSHTSAFLENEEGGSVARVLIKGALPVKIWRTEADLEGTPLEGADVTIEVTKVRLKVTPLIPTSGSSDT